MVKRSGRPCTGSSIRMHYRALTILPSIDLGVQLQPDKIIFSNISEVFEGYKSSEKGKVLGV